MSANIGLMAAIAAAPIGPTDWPTAMVSTKLYTDTTKALPTEAIAYHEDNTAYVYIRDENGNLTEQTVSLGETDGTWVQITEGLEAGDTVFYQYTPSYLMNTSAPAVTMTAAQ